MKFFVTGGAGFIGSHMVDLLLKEGEVVVYDNFSSGKMEFLEDAQKNPGFTLVEGDLLDYDKLKEAMSGCDWVYHFAANPDVRTGVKEPGRDLEQGVQATFNVLEAMRANSVENIVFSSSSTVYGEATVLPTPEDYGPLVPISIYAAAKLGSEAFITSYAHTFNMRGWIFRFANIIGTRGTHGILVDFKNKLENNPAELEILGDGTQKKSYLNVVECVEVMKFAVDNSPEQVNIFNLGSEDQITVARIAEIVVEELKLPDVKLNYTGGDRGWKGDVPQMSLSIEKVKKLGWQPKRNSEEAIRDAFRSLL
ncbi:MAG: NAD-dependent epimerase/dehydratase family protein [Thermoplasmata archaeon]|nr:MAG: NAD-dependent epimerase/dehydratase family protein [Thermoplasmata archaeon]